MTPEVGKMYVTESGHKAVITVDFLKKLNKTDPMGCQYGGYLLYPGKDRFAWWTPEGAEPRTLEFSLRAEHAGEFDPVFIPIMEPQLGVLRPLGITYARFEDIKKEWGPKTEKAVRIQRIENAIVSHTVDLK